MSYTSDENVRLYINASGSTRPGVIGTDVIGTYAVSKHIVWSDSIIDMNLSKRYNTPFIAPIPPAIESMSTILSGWKTLRSLYSGEMPSSLDYFEEEYKRIMSMLTSLRKLEMDLPVSAGTDSSGVTIQERAQNTHMWSSNQNYTAIFDVDSELKQSVSQNRLSDIASFRQ